MFAFEVTRSKPFAPPELEGEYKLTIKGRNMKMEKLDDGIKARATCNKMDDWNMVDGINVCLERVKAKQDAAKEIKVGDKVKVVDNGESYSAYADWVDAHVVSRAAAVRLAMALLAQCSALLLTASSIGRWRISRLMITLARRNAI